MFWNSLEEDKQRRRNKYFLAPGRLGRGVGSRERGKSLELGKGLKGEMDWIGWTGEGGNWTEEFGECLKWEKVWKGVKEWQGYKLRKRSNGKELGTGGQRWQDWLSSPTLWNWQIKIIQNSICAICILFVFALASPPPSSGSFSDFCCCWLWR